MQRRMEGLGVLDFRRVNVSPDCAGAVNISYEVTAGALRDLSPVEGALADPGLDFISGAGSVILQEGQTSVAIPVTIMEVKAELTKP